MGHFFFNREARIFFECAGQKISGGATQEAVFDFARGICVESTSGFFTKKPFSHPAPRIFIQKNAAKAQSIEHALLF